MGAMDGVPHGIPAIIYSQLLSGKTPDLSGPISSSRTSTMEVEAVHGLDSGPPCKRARVRLNEPKADALDHFFASVEEFHLL